MAQLTVPEWKRIEEELTANPGQYGFLDRVHGPALLVSFNVRKLGAAKGRSKRTWEFLARICERFGLVATQEVIDDLSGMRELMEFLGSDFEMIVSDKTGAFPGERGLGLRLQPACGRAARRCDRHHFRPFENLSTLIANRDELHDALEPMVEYEKEVESSRQGQRRVGERGRTSDCRRSWRSSVRLKKQGRTEFFKSFEHKVSDHLPLWA